MYRDGGSTGVPFLYYCLQFHQHVLLIIRLTEVEPTLLLGYMLVPLSERHDYGRIKALKLTQLSDLQLNKYT